MTFEEARERFVAAEHLFGRDPCWPDGYRDGDLNQRFHGTVGGLGGFEIYTAGAMHVELWTEKRIQLARLTVREASALAALLTGGGAR